MNYELLKTLKILIVEDEKRIAQLLKDAISDCFFSVVIAKDGIEGLKKFKTFKPDIIITDIMMPFCYGLEMTLQINELDESIPIIILSAHSEKVKLLKAVQFFFHLQQLEFLVFLINLYSCFNLILVL